MWGSTATVVAAALLQVGCAKSPAATTGEKSVQSAAPSAPSASSSASAPSPAGSVVLRALPEPPSQGVQLRGDGLALAAWRTSGDTLDMIELWNLDASAPALANALASPVEPFANSELHEFYWGQHRQTLAARWNAGLIVWDVPSGKIRFQTKSLEVIAALNPAGDRLAFADGGSRGGVQSLSASQPEPSVQIYHSALTGAQGKVFWAGDRGAVVTLSTGNALLLDGTTGKVRKSVKLGDELPVLTPNTRRDRLAAGTSRGELKLLDGTLSDVAVLVKAQPASPSVVRSLAFSPDDKWLAVNWSDGKIVLWDVAARRVDKTLAGTDGDSVGELLFSPDGKRLACQLLAATWVWSGDMKAPPKKLPAGKMAFRKGGAELVIQGTDGGFQVFGADLDTPSSTLKLVKASGQDSFSDDMRLRATSGGDTRLERTSDGQSLRLRVLRHGARVVPLVYSDEGFFSGDDEVCQAVLARSDDAGPVPAAACAERRRPSLLANFLAGAAEATPR